jgi:hypothetical protein
MPENVKKISDLSVGEIFNINNLFEGNSALCLIYVKNKINPETPADDSSNILYFALLIENIENNENKKIIRSFKCSLTELNEYLKNNQIIRTGEQIQNNIGLLSNLKNNDEEKSNMRWICRRIYNWDLIYQIEDYPDVSRNKKSEIENIKTMCGEIPHTLPTRVKNNLVSYLSGPVGSHTNHFPDDYRTIYQPKPYIGELKQKIMKDQNAGRGKTRKTRKTHKFRLRVARNKQRCKTKAIKKKRPFTKK